ncbi:MAG: Holliday junction branch migration protein RuvA [Acidimicrobiaceae bacterium]|jgi:Holliday junction DNA helicase RuvA|nr:Holliday junction branch migration protein RuvA [Acidimicrobiaceae bacterium]HAB58838.1 Holliday junction branch migration protein RuvA [Acidimicrobiaceae bacterium]
MIGSLRGRLLDRGPDGELLIEVGGVGHRVQVTPSTSVTIGELDGEVFLHTHHSVREDSETLYGFATIAERRVFESLISAHGVGPALGLAILSVHGPDALRRAVAEDDVAALCLVPGVGKKTAARLVMELKSKLNLPEGQVVVPSADGGQTSASGDSRADVRTALEGLGYGADEIHAVLVDLPTEGDVGRLLKDALRRLASGV